MRRSLLALALVGLVTPACLGGRGAAPSPATAVAPGARLTIVVHVRAPDAQRGRLPLVRRRHSLTCSPAGGTMPHPRAACAAIADYLQNRRRIGGCPFYGLVPLNQPYAVVTGMYEARRFTLRLTAGYSWCGQPPDIMRDFWILSTSSCTTVVLHAAGIRPYALCRAPQAVLRGPPGAAASVS